MGKSEYAEKLKSPKWQRRRLEIMERDNFTCQICGNKDATLNVHHLYYNDEPWDAEDDCLITLCEECHEHEHDAGHLQRAIQDLRKNGVTTFEMKCLIEVLSCFIKGEPNLIVDVVDSLRNKTGCKVIGENIYNSIMNLANRRNNN